MADANERRDWRMWADVAAILIRRAHKLCVNDDIGLVLENTVYALDSTRIDLCLSLFPWADFRSTKAAVKMHTLLDICGQIPSFIHVSAGKMTNAKALDLIGMEAGAIYDMDRGYIDFSRLYTLHQAGAFFVTRAKTNMNYRHVSSRSVDKTSGLSSDQSIMLEDFYARQNYSEPLRRINFCDPETKKKLIFLTKYFTLPAFIYLKLYKLGWHVGLFFKWIKQNLRIRHYFGNSENAVKTQIWTAVYVYVLATIIKKELCLKVSHYTFLQILYVHSFEKVTILQAFERADDSNNEETIYNQLNLFDF